MQPHAQSASRLPNLHWNQSDHYWLCVLPKAEQAFAKELVLALQGAGLEQRQGYFMRGVAGQWAPAWEELRGVLQSAGVLGTVEVAVVGTQNAPESGQLAQLGMSAERLDDIAKNLWLGEALIKEHVLCYLQPVHSQRDRIFGYEAFARVRNDNGDIVGGRAIVDAGRVLGIEYALDRHLQIEAIKTFADSGCSGFLFVNFLPGFIQRPEVYLDGLSQTARAYGIVPKHLVLDFTRSGAGHDSRHLQRVCEYCRSKGYAIALDDVNSPSVAHTMVQEIRPDYVKRDMKLVLSAAKAGPSAAEYDTVRAIVEHCHANGTVVLAEGVETEESFEALKNTHVDLYQGYLFSAPVPVEEIKKRLKEIGS